MVARTCYYIIWEAKKEGKSQLHSETLSLPHPQKIQSQIGNSNNRCHASVPPSFLSYPNVSLQDFSQIRKQLTSNYFP